MRCLIKNTEIIKAEISKNKEESKNRKITDNVIFNGIKVKSFIGRATEV